MDLLSVATLSLFGAAAVAGVVGLLVGNASRFELGLGLGLLIFGAVAFFFSARCLVEYRAFTNAGPNGLWGEVLAIVDKPVNASGSITTPVPIVRFVGPDGVAYSIEGPSAGAAKVKEHVNVIFAPDDPLQSRIAQTGELRGGAIAMLLFGTFPSSFGLWLLFAYARSRQSSAKPAGDGSHAAAPRRAERKRGVRLGAIPAVLNLGMAGAILWIGFPGADLQQRFVEGFGAIACLMACYALWGAGAGRLGATWSLGMLVLAVNFGVWTVALHLLQ